MHFGGSNNAQDGWAYERSNRSPNIRQPKERVYSSPTTMLRQYFNKQLAKKLGIKCTKALSRWTSHSLRVTAANELHRLGFNTLFIQHRLRWRSDAFMKYLRHTIHVARKHSEIMSLNSENLKLRHSNLDTINKRTKRMKIHREPGEDDILWEDNFYAAEAI